MAESKLHPALAELRGRLGDLVFRHVRGRLVVSQAPDFSRRKLSPAQQAQCRRFGEASRRASAVLADPKAKAAYRAQAARQSRPLMAVATGSQLASHPSPPA